MTKLCRGSHDFSPDLNGRLYHRSGGCGTPLCEGWTEFHCRKCKWFITTCPCGSNNYEDTISNQRRELMNRKQRMRA